MGPTLVSGGWPCAGPLEALQEMEGLLCSTNWRGPSPYATYRLGSFAAFVAGQGQQEPALIGSSGTSLGINVPAWLKPHITVSDMMGGEETVEHALWMCPVTARFWRSMSEWWSTIERAALHSDLELYGSGLKHLWGMRCKCIWSLTPRVNQEKLIHAFTVRMSKEEREEGGGESFIRVGVGSTEGGIFSRPTVVGSLWWPINEENSGNIGLLSFCFNFWFISFHVHTCL